MFDLEKTKKGLECCAKGNGCKQCPYYLGDARCKARQMQKDAVEVFNKQEQSIEAYRKELAEVRVALAEANKERQELTADLNSVRSRADETIDALHSEVRRLTEELEKRPPRLIITRREPK